MQRIAVIGEGMSSLCFIEGLKKSGALEHFKLDVFGPGPNLTSCSDFSTAVVSSYGVQQGLSPLGDMLHESYERACAFYRDCPFPGVTQVEHLQLASDDRVEQMKKRYAHLGSWKNKDTSALALLSHRPKFWIVESSYLVNPSHLLPRWREELGALAQIQWKRDVVCSFDPSKMLLTTARGESWTYDRVIFCTGAYNKVLPLRSGEKAKMVSGHALHWKAVDLGEESLVIGHNGKNFVYRAEDRAVFLGGSANTQEGMEVDFKQLQNQLLSFLELLNEEVQSKLREKTPQLYGAPREKGPKRMPFARGLVGHEEQVLVVGGHYKNGYSTSFYTAAQAQKWLLNQ